MTLPGQSDRAVEVAGDMGIWLPPVNVDTRAEHARYRMALQTIALPEVGSSFNLSKAIADLALRAD